MARKTERQLINGLIGLFRNVGGGWIDEFEYCSHKPLCSTLDHDPECILYPIQEANNYLLKEYEYMEDKGDD